MTRFSGWRAWLIAAALATVVVFGWRELWFICDDAYIAFRYVSNSMLGRGFVWNPAPFEPVEGYTCLLWVVLLRGVWSITGIQPPDCATELSLLFGLATLAVGWRMAARMRLRPEVERARPLLIVLVLVGVATHRVFLTWLSSGLETSLFVFLLTSWVYFATTPRGRRGRGWLVGLTTTATAVALTRPDGLLCVAATLLLVAQELAPWFRGQGALSRRVVLAYAMPLLGVPAHLLWRLSFYGEWLPNTFRAKVSTPWPESGVRYAASFVFENGAWAWLLLLVAWVVRELFASGLRLRSLVHDHAGALLAIGVLLVHTLFYTFLVGGDYFEYRVYAHLPLLLLTSGAWMASRLARRPTLAVASVGLVVVASWPIAWLHHLDAARLGERVPGLLRPVVAEFVGWQQWLHAHTVCVRRDGHLRFAEHLIAVFPKREDGERTSWDGRPVHVVTAAGVPGWTMPNVALLDYYGLNDRVVAGHRGTVEERRAVWDKNRRNLYGLDHNKDDKLGVDELPEVLRHVFPQFQHAPDRAIEAAPLFLQALDRNGDGGLDAEEMSLPDYVPERSMAHESTPPPGYIEGFRPNVRILARQIVVDPRPQPLTDADIVAWEARWRSR